MLTRTMDFSALAVAVVLLCAAFGQATELTKGETCQLNDGGSGVCSIPIECPEVLAQMIMTDEPILTCANKVNMLFVCCPNATIASNKPRTRRQTANTTITTKTPESRVDANTTAGRKCVEYAQYVAVEVESPLLLTKRERYYVSDCAMVVETLIVGGVKARPKEFPHMAALGFGSDKDNAQWSCGGTLISERFVLTVASCLLARGIGPVNWVRLGDLNLRSTDDDATPLTLAVIERIKHEDYNHPAHYNDIALLKLERDVTFSPYIRPACLYTKPGNPAGTPKATAVGWGKLAWTEDVGSDNLMKVDLGLQDPSRCNHTYRSLIRPNSKLQKGITPESMICAGDPNGTKDTCAGDSGGPLQIQLANPDPFCMYSVIGLTSFGSVACGASDFPAVYTRVSHYIPWIERHVWL